MDIITLGLLVKIAFALSVADDLTDVKKKLWETTGEVAGAWLDKVLNRLPSATRQAMKTAERQIKADQTMLRLDETRQKVALTIAGQLLRDHAPNAAAIVQAAYDADTLTAQILRDGHTILAEIDGMEGENDAVQAVLTILLRHVLTQTDSLQATESLWRKVMQDGQADILAELRRLPDDLFLRHLSSLTLLHRNAPEPFRQRRSANILLTARHTDLPLRGRETEMDDLWQWATNRKEVGVRLLIGPGGHGKTRLALELCRRLEAAGWRAGFAADRWPALSDADLALVLPPDRPTLIVLDYAASRGEVLSALARLAHDWPDTPRFRLLLIEREAGDWWGACRALPGAPEHFFADEKICEQVPMRILPLPDDGPAEIYADALSVFANLLGRDIVTLRSPPDWPADLRLPLFARARALLAVEAAETGGLTAENILDRLITREEGLWRRELYGDSADSNRADSVELPLMRLALTLITLSGPTPFGEAPALLCRLPRLAAHGIALRERLLAALHPLYGEDDMLRGLEPDLLGEHLVWCTVKSPTDPLLIAATGPDASEAEAQTALTILNRLAARKPGAVAWLRAILDRTFDRLAVPAFRVALEQPLPMAALFREVMGRLSFEQALTLTDLMPEYTTELREIAAHVEQRLVDLPLPLGAPPEALSFRAGRLNNLSVRLSELGQREKALAPGEEAVSIRRALAKTRPEVFLPDLALALITLSNRFSNLGQPEKALAVVEEAIDIYRTLAETQPDAFLPNLAKTMNNLSNHLSDLGQREKALAAVEKAADIYRALSETLPGAFLFNLAVTLNNMSVCFSDLGQPEKALEAMEEALSLYRTLAEAKPDAFLPDLAMALNNVSGCLYGLGQAEKALAAVEEAVAIRRTLAETRPEAFMPVLAAALNNLSVRLSDLGQWERAMAAGEEAVAIRRTLAEIRPDVFLPDLATSTAVLRNCLRATGRFDDALATAREAVSLLFPHFRRLPAAFGDRMLLFFQYYTQSAKEAGQDPDPALLDPIVAALIEHGFLPPPAAEPDTPSPA
jgi:tetratricopeptide (TPR) repeat protein